MRIGILTGGGDCPGLNAVIRGIVRKGQSEYSDVLYGFYDGWRGVMEADYELLDIERMRGTLVRGGTVLGTSRISPHRVDGGVEMAESTYKSLGLDCIIAIGGEGTLSCAAEFHTTGMNVIGVPKTIDNDIGLTERTFGFDTAVAIATDAIDRLHTTGESHNRVMVVEVMGRHVGHIATWSGLAGGATVTLIPEHPFDIETICDRLVRRHGKGKYASIVVVAEGAKPIEGTLEMPPDAEDEYGHIRLGGIANRVANEIEKRTGYETRVTVLGHVQRGGKPTAYDRVLATWFGVKAIEAAHAEEWGKMVARQSNSVVLVPIEEAVAELKFVSDELWGVAGEFFS